VTTNRSIRHRLAGLRAGFRAHRSSILAVAASVVTVLALIQVPICGMDMDACLLMRHGGSHSATGDQAGPGEAHAGAACPLAGPNGGMDCCAGTADGKAPAQAPRGTDQQLQKQPQAPVADGQCVAQCVPCAPDEVPVETQDGQGVVPQAPLYTLFSSYLS